jgi:outer membrane receptor for Fe3+-dicitrate
MTLTVALGDRFALMILKRASDPLDNVATSLVVAKRAVVEKSVTRSTNQVLEPVPGVSVEGLDVAIFHMIFTKRLAW